MAAARVCSPRPGRPPLVHSSSRQAPRVRFRQCIIEEGSKEVKLFSLTCGRVRVTNKTGELTIARLCAGDIFGEAIDRAAPRLPQSKAPGPRGRSLLQRSHLRGSRKPARARDRNRSLPPLDGGCGCRPMAGAGAARSSHTHSGACWRNLALAHSLAHAHTLKQFSS